MGQNACGGNNTTTAKACFLAVQLWVDCDELCCAESLYPDLLMNLACARSENTLRFSLFFSNSF